MVKPLVYNNTNTFLNTMTYYFTTTRENSETRWDYAERARNGKRRPPTKYLRQIVEGSGMPNSAQWIGQTLIPLSHDQHPKTLAKLMSGLNKDINDAASAALTLLDGKGSVGMIANRLVTIGKIALAIKKMDLTAAFRYFGHTGAKFTTRRGVTKLNKPIPGLPQSRKWVKKGIKDASSAWLEFTFGWSPLVQDVRQQMKVLERDYLVYQPIRKTVNRNDINRTKVYMFEDVFAQLDTRMTFKGLISVKNPNSDLMNRLGFSDPLQVAWDFIPFSFVADWALNVNGWLKNMNTFANVDVKNPTLSTTSVNYYHASYRDYWAPGWPYKTLDGSYRYFRREITLPQNPPLSAYWHVPEPSLWLATTASALIASIKIK